MLVWAEGATLHKCNPSLSYYGCPWDWDCGPSSLQIIDQVLLCSFWADHWCLTSRDLVLRDNALYFPPLSNNCSHFLTKLLSIVLLPIPAFCRSVMFMFLDSSLVMAIVENRNLSDWAGEHTFNWFNVYHSLWMVQIHFLYNKKQIDYHQILVDLTVCDQMEHKYIIVLYSIYKLLLFQ